MESVEVVAAVDCSLLLKSKIAKLKTRYFLYFDWRSGPQGIRQVMSYIAMRSLHFVLYTFPDEVEETLA